MAKRMYETPEDMELMIENWKLDCQEHDKPPTWPGLALFLGFATTQSLADYGGDGTKTKVLYSESFRKLIKKAHLYVEQQTLVRAMKTNGAGAIFYLKNLGYSDRHQVTVDPVTVVIRGKDTQL